MRVMVLPPGTGGTGSGEVDLQLVGGGSLRLGSLFLLLVSAAAGQEADGHGGNETCSYEFFPEFHLIHPSVKIYFNKNWTQS